MHRGTNQDQAYTTMRLFDDEEEKETKDAKLRTWEVATRKSHSVQAQAM